MQPMQNGNGSSCFYFNKTHTNYRDITKTDDNNRDINKTHADHRYLNKMCAFLLK